MNNMEEKRKMDVLVIYTWYRSLYENSTVSSVVSLESGKSKKEVTQSIRDWVKTWTGKGYVEVEDIQTTFGDNIKYCNIKQKKFNFNEFKIKS